jgi:hypothetical protein
MVDPVIKNDSKHETVETLIKNLPNDITNKIYYDYFYYDYLYNKIQNVLNSNDSQNLNYKPLRNLLISYNILNNTNFIIYLCNKNSIFKSIYSDHYIKIKNTFIHFKKIDSFSLSWLMNLYH